MGWSVEGMYYENCSCDAVCPCTWSNMTRGATNDDCRVALLFEVDKGSVDGVDVFSPPRAHWLDGSDTYLREGN